VYKRQILRFREDKIEYVNCGHPDMLIRKGGSGKIGRIVGKDGTRVSGPFLGIEMMRGSFKSVTFKMKKGDSLLFFTDCLTETINSAGIEYGDRGIINSFKKAPDSSARDMLDYIIGNFNNYIEPQRFIDDLTVMLIKCK